MVAAIHSFHPAMAEPASLTIQGLSAGYGRRTVIHGLSAGPFQPGRLIAVLGPNGSGKSTLLKAIAGLIDPGAGSVRFGDIELSALSPAARARHVVYLPQSLPAAVHLRVLESVLVAAHAAPAGLGGTPPREHDALGVLQRLGIAHLAMHWLDQLSGGQKQLVGLAQALVRRPQLLLLDEPLSSLDLAVQWQVMSLLLKETRQQGLATLIVLHDLNVALQRCDQAVMLAHGRVAGAGRPEQVITAGTLADVYGVRARIATCSRGLRHVLIDGLRDPAPDTGATTGSDGLSDAQQPTPPGTPRVQSAL